MSTPLKFPDWYYGGPYLRVSNPDTDLPRRDTRFPISPDVQARIECEGSFDGERFVAPFLDSNSISEILGELFMAEPYPESWNDDERYRYPTIQGTLARIALRLRTKLQRKQGTIRSNWFNLALVQLNQAASLFALGEYEQARERLRAASEIVQQGNRASRRKVSFIVGPDGTGQKV